MVAITAKSSKPASASGSRSGSSVSLRRAMVKDLEADGSISTVPVRRAFLGELRELYVPEVAARDGIAAVYRREAALVVARDRKGIPISSSSATSIMAPMLEALRVRPGMRVLEVGAGTGYNAALLGRLVGPAGEVISVDVDPVLVRRARKALAEADHQVRVVRGDGRHGWKSGAPFDRIIVTVSTDTVPRAWFDQLVEDGVLVMPFRFSSGYGPQAVLALDRTPSGFKSSALIPGGFMAMRDPGVAQAMTDSTPSISASEASDGRQMTIASLRGGPLSDLTDDVRRHLLAMTIGPPKQRRRLASTPQPGESVLSQAGPALVMYLILHPEASIIEVLLPGRYGVGIIGSDGRGLAAVTQSPNTPPRLDIWGESDASQRLLELVGEWRHLGRPGLNGLSIEIDYASSSDTQDPPWRTVSTVEAVVRLRWSRRRRHGSRPEASPNRAANRGSQR